MASPNFPSTGLVPNVTTFTVGNIIYKWDGEKWKTITADLSADQIKWTDSKTAGYGLDDLQGFTEALLDEAGIVDDGQPDTVGNSQRVDALNNMFTRKFANYNEMLSKADLLDLGQEMTTGLTLWVVSSAGEILLKNGNYAKLIGELFVNDIGFDDSAFSIADAIGDFSVARGDFSLSSSGVTIANKVKVYAGAAITVTGRYLFNNGVDAGFYTIFNTTDDFAGSGWVNPASIVIKGSVVKVDWFATKVENIEDILTVTDQANNINKAWRAAIGDYVAAASDFRSTIPSGVVELGTGYYRTDLPVRWGHQEGSSFYKVTGGRMKGQGPQASFLVRTDMASTNFVLFGAPFTGELTTCDNFKVTAYNPDGVTSAQKFSSAASAGIFFQGDSLIFSHLWVSGMQTSMLDSRGVDRNAVGIQISSSVDIYFSDIFVELCKTNFAVHSSIVSGVNLELYNPRFTAFGVGNFMFAYGETQNTRSVINVSNMQANACDKYGVAVIEGSNVGGVVNLNNSLFDGFNSEFSINNGLDFCRVYDASSISGTFNNITAKNFKDSSFKALGNDALLGTKVKPLIINSFKGSGQTFTVNGACINTTATYVNVYANNTVLDTWQGVMLRKNAAVEGKVTFHETYLVNYTGQIDASTNRQLVSSNGAAAINIIGLTRSADDTTALTIGFINSGNCYFDFPSVHNLTRTISGSAVVTMPQRVSFV